MSIAAYQGVCPTCRHDHSADVLARTTRETADHAELAACPFCGGEAEIVHIEEGENQGGSCVCCTACQASGNLEFGRKENFTSNWNRRRREDALLSEIAALRVDRDEWRNWYRKASVEINEQTDRATQAERQRDELRKALERIADEAPYRSGYCQSDVEYGPTLSADEMQAVARQALANQEPDHD